MATITPALTVTSGVGILTWTGVSTADTMTAQVIKEKIGAIGSVAFTGTWGSATVKLQGSNDGTNYFDLKDVTGNTISATANAYFEFSLSCLYLKPASSGGSADNVEVTVVMRG